MGETRGRWHGDCAPTSHRSPTFTWGEGAAAGLRHHQGPWFLSPSRRAGVPCSPLSREESLCWQSCVLCSVPYSPAAGHRPLNRGCPGVQLTGQEKGPWVTSAQGWCLPCPLSRPSYGPVVPTEGSGQHCTPAATAPRAVTGHQDSSQALSTWARPPPKTGVLDSAAMVEMKGVHPAELGFSPLCGFAHSSTFRATWIV